MSLGTLRVDSLSYSCVYRCVVEKSTFMPIYMLWARSMGNCRSALGQPVPSVVLLCGSFCALATPQHHRNTVVVSWRAITEGTNVGHFCQWVMGYTEQGPTTFESQVNS